MNENEKLIRQSLEYVRIALLELENEGMGGDPSVALAELKRAEDKLELLKRNLEVTM